MTMTCMVCDSLHKVTSSAVSYGGGSSQNSGGVRTKDRGWGDGWGDDDSSDWDE